MDEYSRGNFEFVKEIYPDLYEKISEAESQAYLDIVKAGRNLRDVYEDWATALIGEYGIQMGPGRATLNDKRKALKDAGKLPSLGDYRYVAVNGDKGDLNGYIYWLKFGNQCSHAEKTAEDPDVVYGNLESVLRIVHKAFRQEYARKKGKAEAGKIGLFDPFAMPIGDHYVIKSYVPLDKPVSGCIREYETCSFTETGRVNKYGIVRVFEKKSMDAKLLQLRDKEAFSEAESEAGIQFDGNVQVEVLSKMNNTSSDYYVVIYKFSRKPQRLTDALMKQLNMEERIKLCSDICIILRKFHKLSTPIYHRNLSFDCIYVCRNNTGVYEPSVIKLNCAKIDSGEFGTVIANVLNVQEMIRQQKLLKYIAPEIRMQMQKGAVSADWGKADVYSAGVLFGDILYGQIEPNIVPSAKLLRMGVKAPMVQLMDKMKNPNAAIRPDMETVEITIREMD